MCDIYVLDREFNILGVIDGYVSVIWRPSYSAVGDFEIYLGADSKAISLLKENRYVVRSSDISVDSGFPVYRNVMIIKNINLITNIENGDFLNVTGRELKYILHQRIVWKQTNLTGTVENAIRRLVTENAISPTDVNRAIPNMVLGATSGLTAIIRKQVTGEHLDVAITEICTAYNYGWRMIVRGNNAELTVYNGLNRSYGQGERPYVVFSDEFENLHNTDYQLHTEEYANTSLIGGEGEGIERVYTSVGGSNTGLDRYEIYTDARDLSSNAGTENAISMDEYLELLKERGREDLASLAYTEGFSGEILSDVSFKYGTDFFLGDIVTIVNKYGIQKNVRILSAIESIDDSGVKLLPQFNT